MSTLERLATIYSECVKEFNDRTRCGAAFEIREIYSPDRGACGNADDTLLVRGENLDYMNYLLDEKGMKGSIQLIYADPPFYSRGKYEAVVKVDGEKVKIPAYDDKWTEGIEAYLRMMCIRLMYMRELAADTGYVCIHLDWHVVHYVKVLADEIFGSENFLNEIIWTYKSGGSSKKSFARKHDTLLLYRMTENNYFEPQKEKSYNREMKPYRFKDVEEYEDEKGWYTLVNMKDVWEIDMVGRTSSERTGYATQKPEALLKRLIKSCTKPGDLCADFFGGSGVMAAAAADLDRKSILCDIGKTAAAFQRKRLKENGISYTYMEEENCCGPDDGEVPEEILEKLIKGE
ncbi:MAG: site-specific DNA-methyltransferase [Firmicutes bacterium]|nr:site-specific DNA-methyltransferase [Bacillota bacterium]